LVWAVLAKLVWAVLAKLVWAVLVKLRSCRVMATGLLAGKSALSWGRGGVVGAESGCLIVDCAYYTVNVIEVLVDVG
jgi:hypothetical protein